MKTIFFIAVIFLCSSITAQTKIQNPPRTIEKIQTAHKNVFDLPFEYSYIKEVIMGEITQVRSQVAPNYPSRNQTGENQEKINESFKYWIDNYPNEYDTYLNRVHEITRKYTTTK